MFTVRIYGDDPQAGPGALLSEHEFMTDREAFEFISEAAKDKSVRIELDGYRYAAPFVTPGECDHEDGPVCSHCCPCLACGAERAA